MNSPRLTFTRLTVVSACLLVSQCASGLQTSQPDLAAVVAAWDARHGTLCARFALNGSVRSTLWARVVPPVQRKMQRPRGRTRLNGRWSSCSTKRADVVLKKVAPSGTTLPALCAVRRSHAVRRHVAGYLLS